MRSPLLASTLFSAVVVAAAAPLPNTAPLAMEGDLSAQMIAGIDRFLERETAAVAQRRAAAWDAEAKGDRAAFEQSLPVRRERLARMLGVVDVRVPNPDIEYVATVSTPARVAETDRFTVYAIRWPVLAASQSAPAPLPAGWAGRRATPAPGEPSLYAEGLLLQPKGPAIARVIALPDADQPPEVIAGLAPGLGPELQYARRLAENGCEVIVPALVDRADTFSGNPGLNLFTNHPHREWIYRQSFVLGRNVGGYEIQKILAAVDWFARRTRPESIKIGVAGWGEGGWLALYSAALDPRIDAALVSGYFAPRERLWQEPIYRNVFGLLPEFGDAEIARLIVPRALLVEHAATPRFDGPAAPRRERSGAAPGRILPIEFAAVRAEVDRARRLAGPGASAIQFHHGPDGAPAGPIASSTLGSFLQALSPEAKALRASGPAPRDLRASVDFAARQERLVREMEQKTQRQLDFATAERDEFLWQRVPIKTPDAWREAIRPYREKMWNELVGKFAAGDVPLNPRTRVIHDKPLWTGYEVVLDVLPDVYAWGYLLVPKGIKPGEKRPVVVTQHGVTGLPDSCINEDPTSRAYAAYKAFAVRLAERGFITFAPHNPYRGDDASRVLQRKAHPIGKTIFSVILAQHERILDFLTSLPNVDPARIGFYGLSYGGQSAMRIPTVLERYALSICSGDFNEWTWKNARTDFSKSYMYNAAYERPEFRMGLTFGYAELAALMVPRPFMVERGHNDTVGIDEWVAYEYAKVNRLYNKLRIPHLTEIEFFDGPHTIHGVGTFKFLHEHLNWPEPAGKRGGS